MTGPKKRGRDAAEQPAAGRSRSRIASASSLGAVHPADESPRKKNLRLHQSKIDAARAVLGTATETETIEAALDLIVFRNELVEGVRAMRGSPLHSFFGEE